MSGSAAPCTRAATFGVSPKTSLPVGDHHRPGVHPDAHGQARRVGGGECGVERRHRVDDCESRANGALGIVLARGRPAEVDEQPIAEVLGDVAAEARDRARCGLLVLRDDVAPFLGVELLRERRRADQVAEQNRQLAALAGMRRSCQFRWSGGLRRCGLAEGRAAIAAELRLWLQLLTTARTLVGQLRSARLAEAQPGVVSRLALRTPHCAPGLSRGCQACEPPPVASTRISANPRLLISLVPFCTESRPPPMTGQAGANARLPARGAPISHQ